MATPKISVIVPVYNVEKYLPNCLNSILGQTFEPYELILVDDGSSDKSGFICESYAIKDTRVRVIHKTNGGVSSARNLGLEYAQGPWISFIDADDRIESDMLEKLYSAAASSGADIICCSMNRVLSHHFKKVSFRKEKSVYDQFMKYPMYMNSVSNKLIRQSLFTNHGIRFHCGLSVCEDLDVSFRVFYYASDVVYIDDSCYYYYYNPTSKTSTLNYDHFNDSLRATKSLNEFCEYHGIRSKAHLYLHYRYFINKIHYINIVTKLKKSHL